ncbi:hypothetical protein N7519_009980 [Penicillium mononematosum]|uniref:uncharacterized protein n=1 Tax=Penicillium mononematosum TaxID=268346 RepID=UPI00254835FE|nr:uncharacterized protein N7519_009980 [Penicillium mononematosum]KAJ6179519.1 hypothetical protein N7519_009980 [Penicillium mononematosum]
MRLLSPSMSMPSPRRTYTAKHSDPAYIPELRSRGVVPSTEKVPNNELLDDWKDVEAVVPTLVAASQTLARHLPNSPSTKSN